MDQVLIELLKIINTSSSPSTIGWAKSQFETVTGILKSQTKE